MMKPVLRMDGSDADPVAGKPVMDWPKALWNGAMLTVTVVLGPLTIGWSAVALFAVTTYLALLVGHSVGMHRMLIHRSFSAPQWLEHCLVYVGVMVGMAGPFGVIRIHDIRDWAQRQPACHDFFSHRRPLLPDLAWQLFCRFEFARPPRLTLDLQVANDRFYQFLERTWRWHQLPPAIILFAVGGWSWLVWGICVRVLAGTAGHWTITHFCHRPGAGRWLVRGANVQGADLPGLGYVTFGECWHSNHHAFPESARIGLEAHQPDPGWAVIRLFERLGLTHHVGQPRPPGDREDLVDCRIIAF